MPLAGHISGGLHRGLEFCLDSHEGPDRSSEHISWVRSNASWYHPHF